MRSTDPLRDGIKRASRAVDTANASREATLDRDDYNHREAATIDLYDRLVGIKHGHGYRGGKNIHLDKGYK